MCLWTKGTIFPVISESFWYYPKSIIFTHCREMRPVHTVIVIIAIDNIKSTYINNIKQTKKKILENEDW